MERVSNEWLEKRAKQIDWIDSLDEEEREHQMGINEVKEGLVARELLERRRDEKERNNFLKKLVKVTNEICEEAIESSDEIKGAINWGDLSCVSASKVEYEDGEVEYHVTVSEAAPDTAELIYWIGDRLIERGYSNIYIDTEW